MSTIESSDVSSASMATEAFVRRLDEQAGAGGCGRTEPVNDVFLAPQEGGAQDLDTDAFIRHIAAQVEAVERKSAAATDSIFSETSPLTNTATTTVQQQGGAAATVTREALIQQLYDMAMQGQLGGASSSEHMNDDDDEPMESDNEDADDAEALSDDDEDKDFSFDEKEDGEDDSDDIDSTINFKRDSDSPTTEKKPAKKPVMHEQKAAADWDSSESDFPSPSFSMSGTSFAAPEDNDKSSSESPAVLDLASTPYDGDDQENSDSFGLSVTTPYDFSDAYTLDSPTVTLTDTPKTKPKRKASKKKASKKASKKKASKKKASSKK